MRKEQLLKQLGQRKEMFQKYLEGLKTTGKEKPVRRPKNERTV